MKQLSDLTDHIVAIQKARDWKQFSNPKNVAIALVAEAAELAAHFRYVDTPSKHERLVDEAGDVFYNFLLFCHEAGIDPVAAIEHTFEKIEQNYPVDKAKGSPQKYND